MNVENNETNPVTDEAAKKSANRTSSDSGKTVKKSIYQKLLAIQNALKAPKNLYNSYGKYYYRNAESILEAAKPYLLEQQCVLLLRDDIETIGTDYHTKTAKDDNGNDVITKHEVPRRYIKATAMLIDCATGDSIETYAYANECEHTGMSGDQCTGTASSYARKYCLNALFLLDDTKDSDTDEMKNIENAANSANKSAPQNTGWSKKPAQAAQTAPNQGQQTVQPAPAQPAQTQTAKASGWSKKTQTSSNGWNNR